jgi:ABC-type lipoprotein release transport system permease subunit
MGLPVIYHWRSLFVRRTTTVMTILVVAAVVGVFTWMISFASALNSSLATAGDSQKLIILKQGATAESNSALPVDEFNKLTQLSEVETDPELDEVLISPEMVVQVALPRIGDGGRTTGNIAVRGVTARAFKVHRSIKLPSQVFSDGAREVIVGAIAASQFAGLEMGSSINLGYGGDRSYKIVGHFSAGGGPMESEIWGYLPSLMDAYNRTMYSSASARLRADADPQAVIKKIEGPSIQLTAQTEHDYWQEQSRMIRVYLALTSILVAGMCVAAILSIANTMFSAVAGRTREIAMLRTIGYSRRHILSGFLMEAVFLSVLGGALGCIACAAWLGAIGNTKDMFGAATFTVMAFEIRMSSITVGWALASVLVVGTAGAFVPALRAGRMDVVTALRES